VGNFEVNGVVGGDGVHGWCRARRRWERSRGRCTRRWGRRLRKAGTWGRRGTLGIAGRV
jgi:hypothetical protein